MTSDDASIRARKPKLTVDEQIDHLRSKGVTFDLRPEEDARETLSDKTYYFKLAAYRVLFDKRVGGERDGEYVGLDFGQLRDLAAIDHMLRYTLLPMTLDIEHFAKAKLMREVTERVGEDGYSIVADYLASLPKKSLDIRNGEIRRLENDRYSGNLVRRYDGAYPAWVFVELISFGGSIDFYRFCALRWDDRGMRKEHYLLKQVKAVRKRLRSLDGHRQRLRARDAQRRPDPERGRPRTCGNQTEQAGEAFENVELKGPADNDDGLRLQGAR